MSELKITNPIVSSTVGPYQKVHSFSNSQVHQAKYYWHLTQYFLFSLLINIPKARCVKLAQKSNVLPNSLLIPISKGSFLLNVKVQPGQKTCVSNLLPNSLLLNKRYNGTFSPSRVKMRNTFLAPNSSLPDPKYKKVSLKPHYHINVEN